MTLLTYHKEPTFVAFGFSDGETIFINHTNNKMCYFHAENRRDYFIPKFVNVIEFGYEIGIETKRDVINEQTVPRFVLMYNKYVTFRLNTYLNHAEDKLQLHVMPKERLRSLFKTRHPSERDWTISFDLFVKTLDFYREIR